RQGGISGLTARLSQHAMDLAAMMCLMIEHVRDQDPFWLAEGGLDRTGGIREGAFQPSRIQPGGPIKDNCIEGFTLTLQLAPIVIKRYGFGDAATGEWRAGKTAHPGAIRPKQVAQRRVDRAEECSPLTSAFGLG